MIQAGKQCGYILLPVIVVITLVAAIALLMNTESALESNTAVSELDAQQAQYVTEAGLNHALWLTQQQGCGPYTDLDDEPLGSDSYDSKLTTDLGSTNAVTINVDQDSWIRSDQPTVNNGNDSRLHTRNEAAGTERPLIRYDLSPIAANTPILSATAWFHLKDPHPNFAGPVNIHLTSADWTEADATWDSMSANMDSAVLATIPGQPVGGVWVGVNLTAQLQAWVNGQPNYGITFNTVIDGVHAEYESRESANPPYLEVVVGTTPTSPATLKADGQLANGVTRKIKREDLTLRQHPGFTYLQPDAAAGVDTYLYEWKPTWNYGASNRIWVEDRYSDSTAHGLIRFNIDAIPAGARITSARLELYQANSSLDGGPIGVYRLDADWDEGVKTGGIGESNWTQRDATLAWAKAGGDIGSTRYALTTLPPGTGWSSWEIGALVDAWVGGRFANQGLLLNPESSVTAAHFASSDDTDPTLRPILSITYACTCGEVCLAPQGSGNLLLLRNQNDPDPTDDAKQALFQGWGYTVNLLDDWDDQATYDAAMASNDVMFISGASPFAVGSKLNNAPIGVVNERGELNDELGIATGRASPIGDSIDVIDTDHYITRIFPTAALQVMTANVELTTVAGTIAPGAQILAEIGGTGALVALDAGQVSSGGGAAPARRVLLPAGESEVDWLMTNNGALIVQRALEWGAGNDGMANNQLVILSTESGATLGGLNFTDKDLAEYDPVTDSATLYLDGSALGLAQDIDAVHVLANDHIVLSAIDTITLGGITSENEDLIDYDPVADSATLMFDGSALFTSGSTDISAVHVLDNGHLLLTNEYTATLGGLSFGPNDIVDYDPVANSATLFFDGDAVGFSGWIDAVHLLSNGHIVLSTNLAATLGGINLEPGDLADYDPIADTATLFLDGDLFSAAENVRSAHVGPGSGGDAAPGPFKVLFVVGNVGGPGMTAEEIAHQTLIESWGYTVEIIDDGASQTDFDTAVANNDVVFTTNDITANTLGTKLVNATIGVVTSEDNLSDEFGLASAIAWESGTQVEINDNTHYITSPFATGVLTIVTASESLAYVTGTLSPDLGLLASSTSGYGVVTLEAGDALFGGGNAAGRRAQLPWGGNGFDPGNLNADGLTILKRALEWGADVSSPGHQILLVVGDPAALTPEQTDKKALMESWGHSITLISASNTQAQFDTAAADVDVVYIPELGTAAMNDLDGKADDLAAAVITEEARRAIKLGSFLLNPFVDTTAINVVNNSHYLTETLPLGNVVLSTATQSFWRLGGTLAPDLHILGEFSGGQPALAYIETGETLNDSAPAPARRVKLPWGAYDFDVNLLTADALEIMRRAIEWGSAGSIAAPSSGYTELAESWSATTNNTWQTVDLSVYGVPASAVVEVALENNHGSGEFWAGVRAVGSGLERRFLLHEAEGGGVDTVTLHVQTDGSSQIQHYSGSTGFVSFRLLGYWTGATYVERFDAFKAGADASWQPHDLGAYGVDPDQVAEIALSQTSTSIEWLVGARRPGSGLARRISLHEAEGGGIDVVTLMAATDASAIVEVYAEADSVVDFHLLGYWSTPPGTYTETGGVHGQATVSASWQTTDLSGFGVPANSIAQFVMSNERDARENSMGLRETASTINNRRLDLQEAESGGGDLGTMHVKVDASSQIQWAAEYGATEGFFYPVGWWVLSP